MAIIIIMKNYSGTKKHTEGKILSGLHLALSAIVLSAIMMLLVLLIVLFPSIYMASGESNLPDAYAEATVTASPACARAAGIKATAIATNIAKAAAPVRTAAATTAAVNKSASAALAAAAANEDEEIIYGLIGENTILYNADLEQITGLPATYFVIITGEIDEYYAVNYADLSGYTTKTSIAKIDYEPRLKSGAAYFQAQNDTHSVLIREKPTQTSAQISSLPDGEKAFYYGAVTGEALIPAAGAIWYYVRYGGMYGYVYSAQGSAEAFAVNPGDKVVKNASQAEPDTGSDGLPDWAFILLLSIPAVIIMLALFCRGKSNGKQNQSSTSFDRYQP